MNPVNPTPQPTPNASAGAAATWPASIRWPVRLKPTLPWALAAATVVAVAVGALWWPHGSQAAAEAGGAYATTPLTRGTLALKVSATGTLQPTRSVALGSELSGTVAQVLVDVNDTVQQGQLLVALDPAKLRDAVAAGTADVQAAQAQQRLAEATLKDKRNTLARLDNVARLSGGQVPAATELDSARVAVESAEASVAAAQASVAQLRANLATSQTNLAKANIRSPITGTVLARNVEPGNAVAASLQAVTLLTLAADLKQLKLQVNVDEADVAQLKVGQTASFTVAAQPGRSYPATVTRVAYGSTTTDNVVTYTTQLDVDNRDLSLRPGMTASANIQTVERANVLLVPNSALRFSPATAGTSPSAAGNSGGLVSRLMPKPPGGSAPRARSPGTGTGAGTGAAASGQATLWRLENGQPVAMMVTKGLSDGRFTEVSGPGLQAGLAVITSQRSTP
jgi:HlyD family secretion protein